MAWFNIKIQWYDIVDAVWTKMHMNDWERIELLIERPIMEQVDFRLEMEVAAHVTSAWNFIGDQLRGNIMQILYEGLASEK